MIDADRADALFAIDRIGIRSLVYCADRDVLVFGPDSDVLAGYPGTKRGLDPQGIYNFMYFHMVPGPGTIFSGHSRLLPGHYLQAARGTVDAKPYWRPTFSEDGVRSVPTLAPEFHGALRQGVGAFAGESELGGFAIESRSPGDQLLNTLRAFFHQDAGGFRIHQAVAGRKGVLQVQADLIFIAESDCDPALRILRR